MNENKCPYEISGCPQVISTEGEIKTLNEKIAIQQKYIVEKIDTIGADVKEIKLFINEGLDKKIDERIEAAWNAKVAKLTRWIVTSVIGSSGLTALITLLIK